MIWKKQKKSSKIISRDINAQILAKLFIPVS